MKERFKNYIRYAWLLKRMAEEGVDIDKINVVAKMLSAIAKTIDERDYYFGDSLKCKDYETPSGVAFNIDNAIRDDWFGFDPMYASELVKGDPWKNNMHLANRIPMNALNGIRTVFYYSKKRQNMLIMLNRQTEGGLS